MDKRAFEMQVGEMGFIAPWRFSKLREEHGWRIVLEKDYMIHTSREYLTDIPFARIGDDQIEVARKYECNIMGVFNSFDEATDPENVLDIVWK